MADFVLGELLLPAKRLRRLTWPELDCLLVGQAAARQKDLVGFRRLGTHLHNMFPGDMGPIEDQKYLYLPAVDGPLTSATAAAPGGESLTQMRDRLAAQNAQKLAERAATQP